MFGYFTDPVVSAPLLGSMLMGLSSSLIGTLVFFQRRTLIGEVLSHTSYPGVAVGIILAMLLGIPSQIGSLIMATVFSLLSLFVINKIIHSAKVQEDTALCFTLSAFFGFGVLLVSFLQQSHSLWYKEVQQYLFGQAATMTNGHVYLYLSLAVLVILILILGYHYLQVNLFDPVFAKSIGMQNRRVYFLYQLLIAFTVVAGIRCVGVVLMSSMLIAPPIVASTLSRKFWVCLIIAGSVGMLSAFFGVFFSIQTPQWFGFNGMPTGPLIVLTSSFFCLITLSFFSKQRRAA